MASLKDLCPPRLTTPRLELVFYDSRDPAHLECVLAGLNSAQAHELAGDFGVRSHADVQRFMGAFRLRGPRWAGGVADQVMGYIVRERVPGDAPDDDGGDGGGRGGEGEGRPLIGLVTLAQQVLRDESGRPGEVMPPDIGWQLVPEGMRRGYATEAAGELLRFAREGLGMKDVCVFVNERNRPSNRVAEKLGFTDGGTIFIEDEGLWAPVWTLPHMGKLDFKGTLNLMAQVEEWEQRESRG